MSHLIHTWFKGSLRSSHTVRQNIRTNNSRMFMQHRFFHSQNSTRPSLNSRALKRGPSGFSLFWNYMNAPGNMLFVTTNLIGLGILVTYRCLSTIANAERMSHHVQSVESDSHGGVMDFDFTKDRFDMLKHNLKIKELKAEEAKLAEIEEEHYEIQGERELLEEAEEHRLDEYNTIEDYDYDLPLTEMDLDHEGPACFRYPSEERFHNLLINQLLGVYYINDFLAQIFKTETPNMELLESLSKESKEVMITTLYDILARFNDGEIPEVNSIEEFFQELPLKQIAHFLEDDFATDLKRNLLLSNNSFLTDEYLENLQQSSFSETTKWENVEKLLKTRYDVDSDLYLDVANSLIHTRPLAKASISDIYFPVIEKFNMNPNARKNRNVVNLASVLNSVYFVTRTYEGSAGFNELMKSSIHLGNQKSFFEGLKDLNIDENSLEMQFNRVQKKSKNLSTKGDDFGYTFPLDSFTIALEGLLKFKASKKHIKAVVNKVLKGLVVTDSGEGSDKGLRVVHSNKVRGLGAPDLFSKIPVELFKVFVQIAKQYKDSALLRWCLKLLNKEYDVSSVLCASLYKLLQETAVSLGNEKLAQEIDHVYREKDL